MASNMIYRGPATRQKITVNLPVAGAYLPGIIVTSDGAALTVAAAAAALTLNLLVLDVNDFVGQLPSTAYASGDTAVATRPQIGDDFQVRVAADTYTQGQALALVGSSGYLGATAVETVVVAFADLEGGTGVRAAGALLSVKWANYVVVPDA